MPERIQRRRTKGWRTPNNTVYVGRGGHWGNPFVCNTRAEAVAKYRHWIDMTYVVERRRYIAKAKTALRGKNLACWCPLTYPDGTIVPCHADVLLEIANA